MKEIRLFGVWIDDGTGSGWIMTGDGLPINFPNKKLGNMYIVGHSLTGFKKDWPNAKVREVGEDGMPIEDTT